MSAVSSQGTSFTFAGTAFIATSIAVEFGRERTRVSGEHMGLGADDLAPEYYAHRTFDTLPVVQVEFLGTTAPLTGAIGELQVSGRIAWSGAARCTSSQIVAAVGDLVRGSASFRVQ